MVTPPIPTITEVERITAVADPALRNLQITQCYHELALPLAGRSGGSANWCTFATWASRQAGQTIRKQDLQRALEEALGAEQAARELSAAARRLGVRLGIEEIVRLVWKAIDPEAAFSRSSEVVAGGNLKVFAEIGREFTRFYAECLEDTAFDGEKIERFCAQLHPGEPPDGQEYLRRAFRHYYRALFESDQKQQVELLLLANLEIGYHEQTRLQPEINAALVAPVISPQTFARNLLDALHPQPDPLRRVVLLVLRLLGRLADFENATRAYLAGAQRQAQLIVTETMMSIEFPRGERLRLGQDLSAGFPALLIRLEDPELLALLERIDPTPDSTRLSGTEYWGDLPDRLHFIADLFRCYQMAEALFEPPFTAEQTAALKEGRMPGGRL